MQKHLTVKELPSSEKPYEKCLQYGPGYLSDAELLAVIFRTGTRGSTSVELAQQVLAEGNGNLLNLYDYSIERLLKINGIAAEPFVSGIRLRSRNTIWRATAMKKRSILSSVCLTANAIF